MELETHPEANEEREKGVKSDSHCMMRISSFAVISLLPSFLANALPCLAVLTVSISISLTMTTREAPKFLV